jgi:hypothetical protein
MTSLRCALALSRARGIGDGPLDPPEPDFRCCQCGDRDEDGEAIGKYDDWYCRECAAAARAEDEDE